MWKEHGFGPWAAIEKRSGHWVGRIGLSLLSDWPGAVGRAAGVLDLELVRSAPPAAMRAVHERYLGALAAYQSASEKMLETARDGRDAHLIEAQSMSFRASEDTLRVGDLLWPGEYKPH